MATGSVPPSARESSLLCPSFRDQKLHSVQVFPSGESPSFSHQGAEGTHLPDAQLTAAQGHSMSLEEGLGHMTIF